MATSPLLIFVNVGYQRDPGTRRSRAPGACVLPTLVSVEHSAPGIAHCCCCRPVLFTFITATAASAISRGGREHILLPTDLRPELGVFSFPFIVVLCIYLNKQNMIINVIYPAAQEIGKYTSSPACLPAGLFTPLVCW